MTVPTAVAKAVFACHTEPTFPGPDGADERSGRLFAPYLSAKASAMRRYILAGVVTVLLLAAGAILVIAFWSFRDVQDDKAAIYQSCIKSGRSEEFCAALRGTPDRPR